MASWQRFEHQLYNPNSGSSSNGYGEGLFYKFHANGDFEYDWQVYANTHDCKTQAMVYRKGAVAVDHVTATIKVCTTYARIHRTDHCVASSNYDHAIPLDNETLIWELDKDEYNNTVLWLRYPATEALDFYLR